MTAHQIDLHMSAHLQRVGYLRFTFPGTCPSHQSHFQLILSREYTCPDNEVYNKKTNKQANK